MKQIHRGNIQEYFESFARCFPDSLDKPYAIRVGSRTLFAADTMELRKAFGRLVGTLKRKL